MPGNVRCRRFAREHCHQCILPSVAHWMVNLRSGPSGVSRAIQVPWSVVTSECTMVRINGIWLGSHDVVVHSGSLKSPNSFYAILGGGEPMYLQHNGATAFVKGMVVLFAGGFPPTKVGGLTPKSSCSLTDYSMSGHLLSHLAFLAVIITGFRRGPELEPKWLRL